MKQCTARFTLVVLATLIVAGMFSSCTERPPKRSMEKTMTDEMKQHLLNQAGNAQVPLPERLKALKELGASGDVSLAGGLKSQLLRARPQPAPDFVNYDPAGDERVVDLHTIAALHQLGDDSEIHRLPTLVSQAGRILQGPEDELRNAVAVILSVGRVEPIGGVVQLTSNQDARVVRNAVRTLDELRLPQPPVRQSLEGLAHMDELVSFTINRLKEELTTLASVSRGSLVLSPGVNDFLSKHDYDRGTVRRVGVRLSDIVQQDLPMLDFDYYVEPKQVVACTYSEAGVRWQNWWGRHGPSLANDKEKSRFVLRSQ